MGSGFPTPVIRHLRGSTQMRNLAVRCANQGRRWLASYLVAIPFLAGAPAYAQAQAGSVTGRVVDARSQLPVAGAAISVDGARPSAATGSDGRFRLSNISAGTHRLSVTSIGYAAMEQSVNVTSGSTATVEFTLQ